MLSPGIGGLLVQRLVFEFIPAVVSCNGKLLLFLYFFGHGIQVWLIEPHGQRDAQLADDDTEKGKIERADKIINQCHPSDSVEKYQERINLIKKQVHVILHGKSPDTNSFSTGTAAVQGRGDDLSRPRTCTDCLDDSNTEESS